MKTAKANDQMLYQKVPRRIRQITMFSSGSGSTMLEYGNGRKEPVPGTYVAKLEYSYSW
jgi:hypothetical protein